jgi:methylthioribulose-1-phosphate dehydratase
MSGGIAAVTFTLTAVEQGGRALARECARYAAMGWMRGTSGNLSVVLDRQPLRLAVTPRGKDKATLRDLDVVVVDETGQPAPLPEDEADHEDEWEVQVPSAEAGLHGRIAALSGAGAVVHVHVLAAVLAAERWPGGVPLHDLEMLKGFGRRAEDDLVVVPVVGNSQDMTVLGDRFAATYDPATPALIVARHGLYVWGDDLPHARTRVECLEWLLRFVTAVPSWDGPTGAGGGGDHRDHRDQQLDGHDDPRSTAP